ncbi:MAG: pyridoxal phosphate-dependent aminotransferase family protein [Saprospirales bacterium]|nr:MAG: pyridoxal phosphate-dependent aminotransferase family protein [Saprospirales bacterium]
MKLYTDQLPGRTIKHQQGEYLYFSGTSYLGLSQLKEFKELIKEGIDRAGTHFGGSRLSNIQINIYEAAEERLRQMTGAEDALLVSSGSFAGYLISEVLPSEAIFSVAPGTHSALWKHFSPPFEGSRKDWIHENLKNLKPLGKEYFFLQNSTDCLFCTHSDIEWMEQLTGIAGISLVVDDSHGIGLRGGLHDPLYQDWQKYISGDTLFMGSLGKAMGLPAGFILGPSNCLDRIRATPSFGGSSPPNPAFLYAWLKGGEIFEKQLQKLRDNIHYFRSQINIEKYFDSLADRPFFFCKQKGIYTHLLEREIVISSFNYPGPDDPVVTRVVLNALHTNEDIEKLCAEIEGYEGRG